MSLNPAKMMQCIANRNASGFASKEWLDDPWIGARKGIEQQVMDEGFKLAHVLQRLDDDTFWWADITSIKELIEACEDATSNIGSIKTEHLKGPPLDPDPKLPGPVASGGRIDDPKPQIANRLVLRLTASAIQLALCEATHCIMQKVLESSFTGISHCGGNRWKLIDPESYTETEVTVPEDGIQLAKEIVNEASIIFNNAELPPEVVRLLFPLKVAARMLKYSKCCSQYEQCNAYVYYLLGRKGSNFTKMHPREYFVYGTSRQKNALATKAL
jgi:hypothetical protein